MLRLGVAGHCLGKELAKDDDDDQGHSRDQHGCPANQEDDAAATAATTTST